MATVIVGAGIIGSATAYYLSQSPSTTPPSSIHLIESSPELFASASGYAAGFLARDWFSSSAASLGALSFDLHNQLAKENNGWEKWGYSTSTGISLVSIKGERGEAWCCQGTSRAEAAGEYESIQGKGPPWLSREHQGRLEVISDGDSTAQVDPLRLSHFLLSTCLSRGVHLHHPSSPISVKISPDTGALSSIIITPTFPFPSSQEPERLISIPCTRLVLTAGAWTPTVFRTLFPASKLDLPISSLAGHSLLLRTPKWGIGDEKKQRKSKTEKSKVIFHDDSGETKCESAKERKAANDQGAAAGCHAVFSTDPFNHYSPEIFSRANGEIYLAGLNSSSLPLPELATGRQIEKGSIEILKETARRLLGGRNRRDEDERNGNGNGNVHRPHKVADCVDEDEDPHDHDHEQDHDHDHEWETLREGLCFRPVTSRGTPLIAKIDARDLNLGLTSNYTHNDGTSQNNNNDNNTNIINGDNDKIEVVEDGDRTRNGEGALEEKIETETKTEIERERERVAGDGGGVWIAAGHGPWGISLSLGTGKVMAEMVEGKSKGETSAEVGELGLW